MKTIPVVLTLQEAADRLLTSQAKLKEEIIAQRLRAFSIGGDDWRVTETALLEFMGEAQDLRFPGRKGKLEPDRTTAVSSNAALISIESIEWQDTGPFDYRWPEVEEHMDASFTSRIKIGAEDKSFTIGFTDRKAVGMMRRRAVVFLGAKPRGLRPIVEFVGTNDYQSTGKMASPIKIARGNSVGWRTLQSDERLPAAYSGLVVSEYSNVVSGPNATRSAAVVVDKDNLCAMARHAIIRAKWKGWI
jgi:hypothetical protein